MKSREILLSPRICRISVIACIFLLYIGVRLVGTGYPSRGTIEVLHNGQWGTICDDSFDRKDGDVICRMLGYNFARYFNNSLSLYDNCILINMSDI